ncbi:MAG: alpha/beta hydrolase, partial [Burkholderiaceae bacterium]
MLQLLTSLRWRWAALTLLSLATLAGCVSLDAQQRKWIFQPGTAHSTGTTPIDGFDDVWIEYPAPGAATAVKLHALWTQGPTADAPVLLYLHGARRDVTRSTYRIAQMRELGFAVLAIDYRGFG